MQKSTSSSEYLMNENKYFQKQLRQNIKSNQQEQCQVLPIDKTDDQLSPVIKHWKKNRFDQTTNQSQKHFTWHKTRSKIANSASISISNMQQIENNLSNDLIKKVASKQQEQFIELFPMETGENENNDPKKNYTGKLQEKLQIKIQEKAIETKQEKTKLQDRFKVTKLQINPIEKKPSSTSQLNKRIIQHAKSNVVSSPYQKKNTFIHSPSKNSQFKMKFSYYTPMSTDELLVKLNSSQNSSFSSTKKIPNVKKQFHPTKTHQLNLSIKLNNFGDFINDNNHESPLLGNQNQGGEFRKNTIKLNSATEIINKAKLVDQLYL